MFESASWLVTRGETDRAVAILKRIAAINGKEVSEHVYQNFEVTNQAIVGPYSPIRIMDHRIMVQFGYWFRL